MAESERDTDGRFKPGWSGGPGRPPRQTETDYLVSLSAVVTPERWKKIVERALVDAEAGDEKARWFIARHLLPSPGTERLQRKANEEEWESRNEPGATSETT